MVFDEYAHYYDLLYKDKNYVAEVSYINSLIQRYKGSAESILDLGCGTGKHADLLTEYGYNVHGVDMSSEMLQQAYERAKKNTKIEFSLSNIQDFNLGKNFDVVTALFHVMSYQTSDLELEKVFRNAYKHLSTKGILIFDCWYGPAVLMEKPEIRIKRLENESVKILRVADPVLRENENIVEVNYDVFIENKNSEEIKKLRETHVMRYLFKDEIKKLMGLCGYKYIDGFEFMSNKELSRNTWGGCFIGQKDK